MPNTHSTLTALFSDIADSIRNKAGTSAPIIADAFPAAIDAIPTGGGDSAADGIIDRTISGAYTNANVSMIGSYAFAYCKFLETVDFPSCKTIGGSAFSGCESLRSVNFPACTEINTAAFCYCSSLISLSFPVCISIGNYAFSKNSSITSASFPECEYVGIAAFSECSYFNTIRLPMCKSIGSNAFSKCYRFRSLYLLGSSVPTLTNVNAFYSTPISNYTIYASAGYIIVQASMLDAFKSATNWSVYSSRFSVWNGVD